MSRRPVPVFSGVVDGDGKLHLDANGLFRAYVSKFRNKPIRLTVRTQERPKSRNQLGYLFGVVYPVLAEHLGYMDYEIDALHDAVMRHVCGLRPEPNPLGLRKSLAEMSHEDVSTYIESVRHWALADHGVVTPDADAAEAA